MKADGGRPPRPGTGNPDRPEAANKRQRRFGRIFLRSKEVLEGSNAIRTGAGNVRLKQTLIWFVVLAVAVGAASFPAHAVLSFDIPAETGLLMEAETGQVLWSKNPDLVTEPASLAKIMVMLLVYEAVERGIATWDDRVVTSAYAASIQGSTALLAQGESFTLKQMLQAIAINSANDATVAVAEHLAGSEPAFVEAMNRRAAELGMTNTYYANSDGLPVLPGERPNETTARDMAILAQTLISKFPEVLEVTSTVQATLREAVGSRPAFVMLNTNRAVLRYPGADGLKTGWTDNAGYNLVATASRDGLRLISVVLRADSEDSRAAQTVRLFDYGFNNFDHHVIVERGRGVGNVRLPDGAREQLPVRTGADLTAFVHRSDVGRVTYKVEADPELRAPVSLNDPVGEVVAYLDGVELSRAPAVAAADMGRANLAVRGWRWLRGLIGNDQ